MQCNDIFQLPETFPYICTLPSSDYCRQLLYHVLEVHNRQRSSRCVKYIRAQVDGVIRAKLQRRKHDSGKNTVPSEGTRPSGDNLFQRQVSHETSTKQSLGVEMYVTPITFYALRLSLQQGAVSSVFRKNMAERNITTSACILATVGLSMSIFSVSQMLTSKHPRHL